MAAPPCGSSRGWGLSLALYDPWHKGMQGGDESRWLRAPRGCNMETAAQGLPQSQGPLTARRRVVFTQASGLHLRLADQLVRRAAAFQADIWLEGPGGRANGKSILDLMALAAACGTTLEIEARGPDAEEAVADLAALIGAGFEASEEGGRRPRAASCPATGRILRTETGADPGGHHGANYSLGVGRGRGRDLQLQEGMRRGRAGT